MTTEIAHTLNGNAMYAKLDYSNMPSGLYKFLIPAGTWQWYLRNVNQHPSIAANWAVVNQGRLYAWQLILGFLHGSSRIRQVESRVTRLALKCSATVMLGGSTRACWMPQ